jgi:hypothetical protein
MAVTIIKKPKATLIPDSKQNKAILQPFKLIPLPLPTPLQDIQPEAVEKDTFKKGCRRILHINRWVFMQDLPMSEKLILLELANNAKPGYPTTTHPINKTQIHELSKLTLKTIKKGLDSLITKGFIKQSDQKDCYHLDYKKSDSRVFDAPTAERIIKTNRGIFTIDCKSLTATRILILLAITDHINKHYKCKITYETISEKTGLEKETIRINLQHLEQIGALSWENKRKSNGYMGVNTYTVLKIFEENNKVSVLNKKTKTLWY